jgi:hypothetical protein
MPRRKDQEIQCPSSADHHDDGTARAIGTIPEVPLSTHFADQRIDEWDESGNPTRDGYAMSPDQASFQHDTLRKLTCMKILVSEIGTQSCPPGNVLGRLCLPVNLVSQ